MTRKVGSTNLKQKYFEYLKASPYWTDKTKKDSSGRLQNLKCPECGDKGAWAYNPPFHIFCHRNNKCGQQTKLSDLFPDVLLHIEKDYPPIKSDLHRPATEYLKNRGLKKSLKGLKYEYIPNIRNTGSGGIMFPLGMGQDGKPAKNGRFFSPSPGEAKGHNLGKVSNLCWEHPSNDYKSNNAIWVAESVIDSLSLIECNKTSISSLSASGVPKPFYKKHSSNSFVLALNNDNAGRTGILNHIQFLKEYRISYEIALSPEGKDWNDLLISGYLTKERMEASFDDALWRGRLFTAESIEMYHTIYSEKNTSYTGLLEYRGGYWAVSERKPTKDVPADKTFTHLSDFTLKMLFSIKDDTIEYESEIVDIIEVISRGGKNERIKITAQELTQASEFRRKIKKSANELWKGATLHCQNLITDHLLHQNAPIVRKCNFMGYDKKSGCYLLGDFIYDQDGNRYQINKDGYFARQKVVGMKDEQIISRYEEKVSISDFLTCIHAVYGQKAWLVFGYYVATLFAHIIHSEYKRFPFFSLYGQAGTGKTTFIDVLNQMCFFDWPGLPANSISSKKSIARQLSQKVSMPIPILECNNKLIGIQENSLLNAYHQGSLQDKANYSNDNTVNKLPFRAGLIFVQNNEPFTLRSVKERVVSIEFLIEDNNDDSAKAMKILEKYTSSQLSGIGHQILSKRKTIEEKLIESINSIMNKLDKSKIASERIRFNHAVAAAGLEIVAELFDFSNCDGNKFLQEIESIAKRKEQSSSNESALGDAFLEAFEELSGGTSPKLKLGIHYLQDDQYFYIRLTETIRVMKESNYAFTNSNNLYDALKQHDRCKQQNQPKTSKDWKDKVQFKTWVFAQ